ncbi:MAG: ATP-binding protein [Gammaproteobacteria bacterium]
MFRHGYFKAAAYGIVIGIIALAGVAATTVYRNVEAANRSFQTVLLLEQIDAHLLRSVTSMVELVRNLGGERPEYIANFRIDLSIFHNRWTAFRERCETGYPGISELFDAPVYVDDDAESFFALGRKIAASEPGEFSVDDYYHFLRLGRSRLLEAVTIAESVAQADFKAAQSRMVVQIYIALGAILAFLLIGFWLARRAVLASTSAREAAESAAQIKSDFLSTMSHEIRTPMSGVLGMAELLARTDLTEKQKLYVSTIESSGEALTNIINDVLDLAKINAGKMTVRNHPFNLAMLVEDIATLLAPRASENGNELTVRIQPYLPVQLIGDAGHLRQIIINLAGNAIKFTSNGTVLIDISGAVSDEDVHLTIKVQDSGIGIPPERLPHIFDQFEQVEDPLTGSRKGTGLGLAITSKLVALMGGTIQAISEEGSGSCFAVKIDLAIDVEATENDYTPENIVGARVLVADDNATNRMVVVEQLKSWDLDPVAVENADEAMAELRKAAYRKTPFHLAILDYHMPVRDGLALAAEIRADADIGDTPLMMLTSIMSMDDDEHFRRLRIDGHLAKPARSSLLRDTVLDILERTGSYPRPGTRLVGGAGI